MRIAMSRPMLALCTILSLPAAARQADDAFETAVRAAAPARASPVVVKPSAYVLETSFQKAAAAPGTIPERWRGLKAIPADTAPLQTDVDEGRLDPVALMSQIAGPLPVPPGAQLAGCDRNVMSIGYTLDENLSAAFDALTAQGARADLGDVLDRASIDARPIRDRLHAFLTARGYTLLRRAGIRATYRNRASGLNVEVEDTSAALQKACDPWREKMRLPTGPVIRIEYARD